MTSLGLFHVRVARMQSQVSGVLPQPFLRERLQRQEWSEEFADLCEAAQSDRAIGMPMAAFEDCGRTPAPLVCPRLPPEGACDCPRFVDWQEGCARMPTRACRHTRNAFWEDSGAGPDCDLARCSTRSGHGRGFGFLARSLQQRTDVATWGSCTQCGWRVDQLCLSERGKVAALSCRRGTRTARGRLVGVGMLDEVMCSSSLVSIAACRDAVRELPPAVMAWRTHRRTPPQASKTRGPWVELRAHGLRHWAAQTAGEGEMETPFARSRMVWACREKTKHLTAPARRSALLSSRVRG